jgi:mannan endo-1,4-beta-mannosidase
LNTAFKSELDAIAARFAVLQDNGVVVMWRPLHEMDGSWFWWGNKDTTQFKNVWIYMFNYLTTTKGLHNILWIYSPNASLYMNWYPGDQYVDIVGVDSYGYTSSNMATFGGYSGSLSKPFAITEYGPCSASGCTSPVNLSNLGTSILTVMPKTAFWVNWAENFSLSYNSGASTLLNAANVITRDEIPSFESVDIIAPVAPTGLTIQ